MSEVFTLTEAKARFSEIINRIIYNKEKIIVTKKGKQVAVILPPQELEHDGTGGLIKALGALPDLDDELEEMMDTIYQDRKEENRSKSSRSVSTERKQRTR